MSNQLQSSGSARNSITTLLCWNGLVKYPAARGTIDNALLLGFQALVSF